MALHFYQFMIIQNHENLSTIPKDDVPITLLIILFLVFFQDPHFSCISMVMETMKHFHAFILCSFFLELILPSCKIAVFDVRKIQRNRFFNLPLEINSCDSGIKRILESRIWFFGGIFYFLLLTIFFFGHLLIYFLYSSFRFFISF